MSKFERLIFALLLVSSPAFATEHEYSKQIKNFSKYVSDGSVSVPEPVTDSTKEKQETPLEASTQVERGIELSVELGNRSHVQLEARAPNASSTGVSAGETHQSRPALRLEAGYRFAKSHVVHLVVDRFSSEPTYVSDSGFSFAGQTFASTTRTDVRHVQTLGYLLYSYNLPIGSIVELTLGGGVAVLDGGVQVNQSGVSSDRRDSRRAAVVSANGKLFLPGPFALAAELIGAPSTGEEKFIDAFVGVVMGNNDLKFKLGARHQNLVISSENIYLKSETRSGVIGLNYRF